MSDKIIVQKIVLAAVIVNNNQALIVQRNEEEDIFPGLWELPGGKRELLESSETALLREVKEEVGLEVKIISAFSVFDYQIEKEKELRDSTQINFLVKPKGSLVIKLSKEHQDFRWINKEEIENINLSTSTKGVIKRALEVYPNFK